MFKVVRVNTNTAAISSEDFKEEYKTLGNRGLIARVMTDEVDPQCDPLGPDNKLIICSGILAGTSVTTAHRTSVGGKSPLTGGIKEANAGGNVGSLLAQHAIKMIIFEDQPDGDTWRILKINADGQPELMDASEYVGMNTYAFVEKMHDTFGDKIGVMAIGTAGEQLCKVSTVQVTDFTTKHPARVAARGGLGAVLGSKKIKAVVVEKPAVSFKFPYADKEIFDRGNKSFVNTFLADGPHKGLSAVGTVVLVDLTAATGMLPVKNFSAAAYEPEKLAKLNPQAWMAKVAENGGKTGVPCQPGCLVKCSNVYNNSKGEFITSGIEYETYALAGPNCDITNIDFIAQLDRICDDFGVDTIEAGCALGILMDEGKLTWGDAEAALDVLQQMSEGKTELGKLMAQGADYLGKAIGAKRIPTAKKQALAAYDPRNLKGAGVTYATSPMGADHTAGLTFMPGIDHTAKEGKVQLSLEAQIRMAAADNFMCSFAFDNGLMDPTIYPDIMQGAFGIEWNMEKMMALGRNTLKLEWAWNRAAGLQPEDDRLPQFFYDETSPMTNSKYDIAPEELQTIFTL